MSYLKKYNLDCQNNLEYYRNICLDKLKNKGVINIAFLSKKLYNYLDKKLKSLVFPPEYKYIIIEDSIIKELNLEINKLFIVETSLNNPSIILGIENLLDFFPAGEPYAKSIIDLGILENINPVSIEFEDL